VALALVVAALQAGAEGLRLPGGTVLRAGSDDFVLSNYSFQNGDTYFLDINGSGVRNIIEIQRLSDAHTLQVVFHHATRDSKQEHHLVSLPTP
jgi:hypothetical protein